MVLHFLSLLLRGLIALLAILTLVACHPVGSDTISNRPDISEAEGIIYVARDIVTMNPDQPNAQSVAVKNGIIVKVGGNENLLSDTSLGNFAVDTRFQNHVLVPGFIEQHVHPLLAALAMGSDAIISIEDWDTPNGFSRLADSQDTFRERLSKAIADFDESQNRPMLVWGYHGMFHGYMSRSLLDDMAAEVPVVVWQRSTHEAFLNTAAMDLMGISQAYIDNWPSELARSQVSLDEGRFTEAGFWELLFFEKLAVYFANPQKFSDGLLWTGNFFHRNGITTLAEPAGPIEKELQSSVAAAYGPDATPFNFYFIPDGRTLANMYFDEGSEKLIEETERFLERSEGRTQFLPQQVKLFLDGAIYAQLMVMRDGYLDGHHGEWLMTPDVFEEVFLTYWRADYQIHIHYNGDGGLDKILDTLTKAQAEYSREDHRTVLVHFGYAQSDQIMRAADLGMVVSANPAYTTTLADKYSEEGIGRKRTERMVPLAEAVRSGISVSLHSDMPMAPAAPLQLMSAAVNRETPSGWVPGPNQRLTPEQALRAVTLDAAFSIRLENEIGSLEVGKKANFTVLAEDPLTIEPAMLGEIDVWGTVLEGRLQPVE